MERPPRGSYGVVDFLLWPLAGLTVLVVAQVLARRAGVAVPDRLTGSLFYAGWTAWTLRRAGREPYGFDLRAMLAPPARRTDWRYLLLVVPLLVVSATALYLVMVGLSVVVPPLVSEWIATPEESASPRELPGHVVENAFGAVAEELVFRGVLLELWAARFGVRFAVLGTSTLFAVGHADVVGALIFGIVMAALYVRTGTLAVPIVAHLVANTLIDVLAILVPDEGGADTLAEFREDWWVGALAFVGALALIVGVVRAAVPGEWRLPSVRRYAE